MSAGEAWRKPAACREGVGEEKPRRAGGRRGRKLRLCLGSPREVFFFKLTGGFHALALIFFF